MDPTLTPALPPERPGGRWGPDINNEPDELALQLQVAETRSALQALMAQRLLALALGRRTYGRQSVDQNQQSAHVMDEETALLLQLQHYYLQAQGLTSRSKDGQGEGATELRDAMDWELGPTDAAGTSKEQGHNWETSPTDAAGTSNEQGCNAGVRASSPSPGSTAARHAPDLLQGTTSRKQQMPSVSAAAVSHLTAAPSAAAASSRTAEPAALLAAVAAVLGAVQPASSAAIGGAAATTATSARGNCRDGKVTKEQDTVVPALPDQAQQQRCAICLEDHPLSRMLCANRPTNKPSSSASNESSCGHYYCHDCMQQYVSTRLQARQYPVACPTPNCGGVLDHACVCRLLDDSPGCLQVLHEVEAIHALGPGQYLYCPHKGCSALLARADVMAPNQPTHCPACCGRFCPTCLVPGWHEGFTCAAFQALPPHQRSAEDAAVLRLSQQQQWRNCPACSMLVERTQGCNHVRCRCGAGFCYACGQRYLSKRPTERNTHGTPGCRCSLFDVPPEGQAAAGVAGGRHRNLQEAALVGAAGGQLPNPREAAPAGAAGGRLPNPGEAVPVGAAGGQLPNPQEAAPAGAAGGRLPNPREAAPVRLRRAARPKHLDEEQLQRVNEWLHQQDQGEWLHQQGQGERQQQQGQGERQQQQGQGERQHQQGQGERQQQQGQGERLHQQRQGERQHQQRQGERQHLQRQGEGQHQQGQGAQMEQVGQGLLQVNNWMQQVKRRRRRGKLLLWVEDRLHAVGQQAAGLGGRLAALR